MLCGRLRSDIEKFRPPFICVRAWYLVFGTTIRRDRGCDEGFEAGSRGEITRYGAALGVAMAHQLSFS